MAFCSKCGKELAEGAQFCAGCGAPVNGAAGNDGSKRVQTFVGEIRKCPSCGTVLESFQAVCPSCGYELTGVKANNTVHEFFKSYGDEDNLDRKISKINTFPIPNTKEDLFEFAILAESQIQSYIDWIKSNSSIIKWYQQRSDKQMRWLKRKEERNAELEDEKIEKNAKRTEKRLYIAWKNKFDQICTKANLVFDNNSEELAKILGMKEKMEKNLKAAQIHIILKFGIPIVAFIAFYVVFIIIYL